MSRHITDMKRHLQTLEGSRSNRLKRFGAFMPQLIQKIDDAHKRGVFHQKPVGPVGMYGLEHIGTVCTSIQKNKNKLR